MSVQAIGWALAQKVGSASAKAVLVAVANYADENGRCWPSQLRLASDTELTDRSVRTALAVLEEKGFIQRIERRRPDGTRSADVVQILCQPETPSKQPEKSSAYQPEGVSEQPEGVSGLTSFEPSLNHQSSRVGKPTRSGTDEDFEAFRKAYPRREGADPKAPARKRFDAAVKAGADPQAIIAGARSFAAAEQKRGKVGTPYIPHSAVWLNRRGWEDETGASSPSQNPPDIELQWRNKLSHWRRTGAWPPVWGPEPGHPGCIIPAGFINTPSPLSTQDERNVA